MPLPLKTLSPALLLTAMCAAASAATLPESSGTYACSYRDFAHCTQGTAKVTLREGKLQAVSFENSFCPVKNKPAGSCALDSTRGGPQPWADDGRRTTITFPDPDHPNLEDVFAVSVEDERIVLIFTESQPVSRCKHTADLPSRIFIDPRTNACRVVF